MPENASSQIYQLGMNAKIYLGESGATQNPTTVLGNTKDVTLNLETGEADITTRDNGGFRATAPTLKECTAEWEMIHRKNEAALAAIRKAWLTNTTVRLAILTDTYANGGDGPLGDFAITNFTRNEPLEEAITYNVTAKLAKFEKWLPEEGSGEDGEGV